MIRVRRQLFLRAVSRYGNLSEAQVEQVRVALEDPEKVEKLGLFMRRDGAARLERLQALGRWIVANWATIAKILGIVIMFLDTPDEDSPDDSEPEETIRVEAPGHEFDQLQSLVRAQSPDASPVPGKGKV
jgi:hypothetical protein